ncbi:MAG: putative rane protein [Solirubrobacteraceae bacterium]|jgi:putative membrane protein|nr:putative rane protein [Solirubrobacteraceae bacterium]
MFRRAVRLLPLLAAALLVGALSTGSFAVAGDRHSNSHSDQVRLCDKSCNEHQFSAWDEQWLMMSIQGDLFEIQGGKIAQAKGTTQKVRDLGARLVKDHSESLKKATDLAKKLGIEVPGEPSPTQQWELRAVQQFKGAEFDRWYSDLEVQDHKQDIKEAQDEVDKGCNHDVREDAEDEIPTLQEHLRLAQDALASLGS